jgi:hypothetical protein
MAWQKIGSLGLIGDMEILRRSGCHTAPDGKPDEYGHRWVPVLDEKIPADSVDRLKAGWSEEDASTIDQVGWSFHPDCKDCVREAKRYFVEERGLTRAAFDRMLVLLGRKGSPKPRDKDAPSAKDDRYGFREDGSYGELKPWHLMTATPDSPAAVRPIPRMSREFALSREYRAGVE